MSEERHPPDDLDVDVEAQPAPLTVATELNTRDQVMEDNPSSSHEVQRKSPENNGTLDNDESEDELMEDGGVRLESERKTGAVVDPNNSDREVEMVNGNHTVSDNPRVNGIIDNISSQVNGITNGFITPSKDTKLGQVNAPVNGVNGTDHRQASEPLESRGTTRSPSKKRLPPPNPKTQKEILRLTEVLHDVSKEAAQRFFREQWRAVLFEPWNEDYLTFILRAGLKNCSTTVINRLFKDAGIFKDALVVASSNHPEVRRLVMSDITLDELPDEALDEVLAKRVKDVPATTLVKWLAEAGRLGYRPDDLIDLETESVTPNIGNMNISEKFPPVSQITSQAQQVYEGQKIEQQKQRDALAEQQLHQRHYDSSRQDPLLLEQERNLEAARLAGNAPTPKLRKENSVLNRKQKVLPPVAMPVPPPINGAMVCPFCHRMLATLSGYNFHVSKKVCMQELPIGKFFSDYCDNCQKGFVGKQGLLYHTKKNVCRGDDFATVSGPAYIAPAPGPLSYAPSPGPVNGSSHAPSHSNSPTNQLHQEAAAKSPTPPSSLPPSRPVYSFAPKPLASTPSASERPYKPRASGGVSSIPSFQTPGSTQSSRVLAGDVPGRFIGPGDLPADKLLEMNSRIEAAEQKYNAQLASITHLQGEALEKKIASLKQGTASKKSMIRKEYGVTVRQKKVKPEDGDMSTPVNSKLKLEGSRAPSSAPGPILKKQRMPEAASMHHSSPAVSLASSFSPINAPRPPTAPPGYMTVAHYPGQNLTMRANSYGQVAPPPPQQGFDARHQLITAESYAQSNKRRRTEGNERDSPSAPRPSDQGLREVRSEDAADVTAVQKEENKVTKEKKKVPVRDAQAKWEALHGKGNFKKDVNSSDPVLQTEEREDDTPMADAPPATDEGSEQNGLPAVASDQEENGAPNFPASTEQVTAQDDVLPSVEAVGSETIDKTENTPATEPEPEPEPEVETKAEPVPAPAPAPVRGSLRMKRGTKRY